MSYQAKVESPAPHKLLACDGGGIRGIISVEILTKIEVELRGSSGNPNFVLARRRVKPSPPGTVLRLRSLLRTNDLKCSYELRRGVYTRIDKRDAELIHVLSSPTCHQ